jgi:hypothetical protein
MKAIFHYDAGPRLQSRPRRWPAVIVQAAKLKRVEKTTKPITSLKTDERSPAVISTISQASPVEPRRLVHPIALHESPPRIDTSRTRL